MTPLSSRALSVACALYLLPCSALADTPPPPSAGAELVLIEERRGAEARVAMVADWSRYSKIRLDTATVEFRDNWLEDQRRRNNVVIRERDQERIKTGVADLLEEVLIKELTGEAGYALTDENGEGVLHMTPRVIKLDIVAPDRVRNYIGTSLTDSQGSMTLELEIRDSMSGELLASSWQNQFDQHKGYVERTDSVTNRRAFRLMMQRWASWLHDWLDEARSQD